MNNNWITLMIVLPFFGALIQAVVPSMTAVMSRSIALGTSIASSLCGIVLVATMNAHSADPQVTESLAWIGSYAISYKVALDGLNALMVLLISIIFPLLIASEWNRKQGMKGMHGLLLMLQAAFLGTVCAQDLFLLFFFWAITALPVYFLIGIWGGPQRESAAFKSIVSASIGNSLLFGALLLIYFSHDPHTFALDALAGGKFAGKSFEFLGASFSLAGVAFGLLSAGIALRTPVWPLHGWFTHAAEEAPPSVFVVMSAISVPVAGYIFVRLAYSLFPDVVQQSAQAIVWVGALNLVMGSLCALAQRSLMLMLAFICLSEIGLILMGIGSLSSTGVVGAVFHEFSLGLALAGFGLFSGVLMNRMGHGRFRDDSGEATWGGTAMQAPNLALVAGLILASLLGFPGSGGFVGHSLLMIGSYTVHPLILIPAALSFLFATYFLFTMYRMVFLGKFKGESRSFSDLSIRERAYMIPLVGCLMVFGIYPKPLIDLVRPTVLTLLSTVK